MMQHGRLFKRPPCCVSPTARQLVAKKPFGRHFAFPGCWLCLLRLGRQRSKIPRVWPLIPINRDSRAASGCPSRDGRMARALSMLVICSQEASSVACTCRPSSQSIGLDQIRESLLPSLVRQSLLALDTSDLRAAAFPCCLIYRIEFKKTPAGADGG